LRFNTWLNHIRTRFGLKYWSLSKAVKTKTKEVLSYAQNYKEEVRKYTKLKNCDGIICGHIHIPELTIEKDFIYGNCGDWLENTSYIVETLEGNLELCN
jgi:UDP-2,3-diacylglucosamine pyrophosphatase LpxH